MPNLHSHAFQRAMAGMTERRGPGDDSFWTWRATMYRFLDALTPEDVEAIAALAYVEMLEAGFASVAEFHYLHHQPGGAPYADPAELAHRIAAAAAETGIGLTLLPVLYSYGGAGAAPLAGGQRRFGCDLDGFLALREASRAGLRRRRGARRRAALAARHHARPARRAASPRSPTARCTSTPPSRCRRWPTSRPGSARGRWRSCSTASASAPRWCLIHCTQMTADETARLAASGAVAGLCPITEANLGDGIFPGAAYLAAGGAFGVGSDFERPPRRSPGSCAASSTASASPARPATCSPRPARSVGATLYRRRARRRRPGARRGPAARSRPGALADLVAIDRDHPALAPLDDDAAARRLDLRRRRRRGARGLVGGPARWSATAATSPATASPPATAGRCGALDRPDRLTAGLLLTRRQSASRSRGSTCASAGGGPWRSRHAGAQRRRGSGRDVLRRARRDRMLYAIALTVCLTGFAMQPFTGLRPDWDVVGRVVVKLGIVGAMAAAVLVVWRLGWLAVVARSRTPTRDLLDWVRRLPAPARARGERGEHGR